MEKSNVYQALEDDFAATFIRELMPGVLHNFANPLNGIMGRSKLLQRRIDAAVKKIDEKYPEAAAEMQEELQRIKNDVRSVNKESDAFYEMFRDASAKFYALAAKGEDRINLSQLLAAEMRFANFYLEFKHEIKKEVRLDDDTPDLKGNTAELSLVFWRLMRFAMTRSLESISKEFFLTTQHDIDNIVVFMKYSGEAQSEEEGNILTNYLQNDASEMKAAKTDKGVLLAVMILKKYSAQIKFCKEGEQNVICVTLPYRISKS